MSLDPTKSTETIKRNHECIFSLNDFKALVHREIDKREVRYETQRSTWFKLLLVFIPFIVGFFIWTANLDKRVTIMEQNNIVIRELRKEIREINLRLHNIELILAREGLHTTRSDR